LSIKDKQTAFCLQHITFKTLSEPAMAQEYYIREPDSETARGPFDMEKIATLAEAGQVTRETLYYDDELESWAEIGSNEEIALQVFPEKKRLTLRQKDATEMNLINRAPAVSDEPVKVEEMLAAAGGDTRETRSFKKKQAWEERTAKVSIPVIGSILAASAVSLVYPSINVINRILDEGGVSVAILLQHPALILGFLDTVMAIFLFLAVTEVFPLVRLRAAFGIGFFGFTYWSAHVNGVEDALYACYSIIAYGLGLYFATLTLSFKVMFLSAIIGFAGVGGYLYFTTIKALL